MKTPLERLLGPEDEPEEELDEDEKLVFNLVRAQQHAQQALDLTYGSGSSRRSLWYRLCLGRAQSILMSLCVRELGRHFGGT